MKCGELGFKNTAGQPCGQNIGPRAAGCVFHDPTTSPEAKRAIQLSGGIASRMRTVATLPVYTPAPVLDSPGGCRALIGDTVQQCRTGQLDHRIAAVVIAGAQAAIKLAELELAAVIGNLERRLRLRGV